MPTLNINVLKDTASPLLRQFVAGLKSRYGLNQMMGVHLQNCVRDHFLQLSQTRHATAQRLGATPSGHWGRAAEKVAQPAALATSEELATLTINQPGITRALGDVTIRPGPGHDYLTIPLIAAAYNRRAYRVPGLFRPLRKGAHQIGYRFGASGRRVPIYRAQDRMHILAKRVGDGLVKWYALVKSVTQRQDRTLLPSDQQLIRAGREGILAYIERLRLAQRGGLA